MKLINQLLAFCPLVCALCASISPTFTPVESLSESPEGWTRGGRPDARSLIKFRLSAKMPHDILEQQLIEISTPGTARYGKHLSRAEALLLPHHMVTNAIVETLNTFGGRGIEQKGHWFVFTMTVSEAEKFLDTKFHRYSMAGETIIRTLKYSIPRKIKDHVQMVQPTTRFGTLKPFSSLIVGKVNAVNPPQNISNTYHAKFCNTTMTPECLRGLYGLENGTNLPTSSSGNSIGISGFLEQWGQASDLNKFTSSFAPYAGAKDFSVIHINGGDNQQNNLTQTSMEANLDIQYARAVAPTVPVTFYTTGGRGPLIPDHDEPAVSTVSEITNEPYIEQLSYLLDLPDSELPTVLTTSYGDDEQSLPHNYAVEVCRMFLFLGARGVSVIFSSGDNGVGMSCLSNDGQNRTQYIPIFPATCPYVTSVGGTTGVEPERAISFSSGGFSNVFIRPWYQQAAVGAYLECHGNKTSRELYNRDARGYPDVSAQAKNFVVVDKGVRKYVSGTSASAPVFAAIVANINAIRFAAGLPSMGFLNPFLYGEGRVGLTDITLGGSTGCTGFSSSFLTKGAFVPYAGWNATEGWDPVTGLGTPLFQKLAQASLKNATRLSWSASP